MNKTTVTKNHDPVRRWGCAAFIIYCMVIIAGLMILLVSLCGCTRTVYTPVESVRTDTLTHVVTKHDTVTDTERVFVTDSRYDSVAPILDSLNRVIGYDRYHFREVTKMTDKERQRLVSIIDSLSAVSADTIREPYPVERPLSRWEQTKMDFGGAAIGGLVIALCIAVVWLIKRFRK